MAKPTLTETGSRSWLCHAVKRLVSVPFRPAACRRWRRKPRSGVCNEYGPSEAIPAVLCSFGPKSLSFSAQTTALASFLIFFARPLWTITEKDLHIVRTLPKVLIFTRTPPFAAALSPLGGGSAKQKEVFLRRIQICPRSSASTWVLPTPAST